MQLSPYRLKQWYWAFNLLWRKKESRKAKDQLSGPSKRGELSKITTENTWANLRWRTVQIWRKRGKFTSKNQRIKCDPQWIINWQVQLWGTWWGAKHGALLSSEYLLAGFAGYWIVFQYHETPLKLSREHWISRLWNQLGKARTYASNYIV